MCPSAAIAANESELERLRGRVAELEARERELRALLDGGPQACIIHREQIYHANESAARLFGYPSVPALLDLPSVDALLPESWQPVLHEQREARLRGEPVPEFFEITAVQRDGTPLVLRVHARPVTWEGRPAVHCAFTDVSDRRAVEQELRDSHRLLQAVLDALPHWLVVKDREGRCLLANRAMADAFQTTPEQMRGRTVEEVGPAGAEERGLIDRIDHEVVTRGDSVTVPEHPFTMPDGTRQFRQMIKAPLHDDAGEVVGLVGFSIDVTRQHETELQLRRSEGRLRSLVAHLPGVLCTTDSDGMIRTLDGAGLSPLGIWPELLIGQSVYEFFAAHLEKVEDLRRAHAGADVQTTWHYEGRVYDMRLTPLRDDTGRPIGMVGLALDVTERVQAERAREAGQRMLQNVVDTIPHMVFVKDLESRYLLVNRAMAEVFGVEPESLLGRPPDTLPMATAEQRKSYVDKDAEVWATGARVDDHEFPATLPDGTTRRFRSVKVPLRDENGATVGLVGVAEDITERIRYEDALQAHRRLLQAVFDAIPTWLFVKDRESRYVMVNDLLAREVGHTPEHFRGLGHDDAPQGTAAERAKIRRDEERIIADGTPVEAEEELTLPDGTLTYRHVRKVPLRDEAGNIIGIVGISEDITARRTMEEQVRRMQRMESIGTLAGGIAHDFNNILFPIIGFTDMTMRELDADSKAHQNLTIVRDAALRAKDIVSQILTFSRRSDAKPQVMPLGPLVREGLRFLRSTLPRSVHVQEALDAEVGAVFADAVQMHQVLMNLCVNAAHAMPDGGELTVALHAVTLEGRAGYTGERLSGPCVALTVRDTGTGMDADTLARIFEPFFTTKPTGKGTGLGLSTVMGIVSQHGGIICVDSQPGRGSTFEVLLPREGHRPEDWPSPALDATPHADAEILFVDDEWAITELATTVLEELGYRVSAFTSSESALAAFKADPQRYDLVVTDQMMPGLTGLRLARELRAVRADIPVILGTGYSDLVSPERSAEPHLDEVFHKPITPEALGAVVRKVLAARLAPAGPR